MLFGILMLVKSAFFYDLATPVHKSENVRYSSKSCNFITIMCPDLVAWLRSKGQSTKKPVVASLSIDAAEISKEHPKITQTPTENSLAGVKSQDLGGQFTGPKREIRRSPNVSFNKSIVARKLCDMLRRPRWNHSSLDIMIVQFRNEKLLMMALYRSPLL
ncbi:hypothetical protein TNCV_150031 [Trichonephila clavipes]|nr:hypothetical protein TNCV_150031 [Trichonephila clavipes]